MLVFGIANTANLTGTTNIDLYSFPSPLFIEYIICFMISNFKFYIKQMSVKGEVIIKFQINGRIRTLLLLPLPKLII